MVCVDGSEWAGMPFPSISDVPETIGSVHPRDAASVLFGHTIALEHRTAYLGAFVEKLRQRLGPSGKQLAELKAANNAGARIAVRSAGTAEIRYDAFLSHKRSEAQDLVARCHDKLVDQGYRAFIDVSLEAVPRVCSWLVPSLLHPLVSLPSLLPAPCSLPLAGLPADSDVAVGRASLSCVRSGTTWSSCHLSSWRCVRRQRLWPSSRPITSTRRGAALSWSRPSSPRCTSSSSCSRAPHGQRVAPSPRLPTCPNRSSCTTRRTLRWRRARPSSPSTTPPRAWSSAAPSSPPSSTVCRRHSARRPPSTPSRARQRRSGRRPAAAPSWRGLRCTRSSSSAAAAVTRGTWRRSSPRPSACATPTTRPRPSRPSPLPHSSKGAPSSPSWSRLSAPTPRRVPTSGCCP